MNKSVFRYIVIASLLIVFAFSQVVANDLLISEGLRKKNVGPQFAINSFTGDVLVVWTKYDVAKPTYARVYAVLLKRLGDENYKIVSRVLLSKRTSYNANPSPMFNPHTGKFLVAWDQADPSVPFKITPVMGRMVTSSGVASGKAFTILATGNRLTNPQLYYRDFSAVAAPPETPVRQVNIAARFVQIAGNDIKQLGINWALLDNNNRAWPPRTVFQGGAVNLDNKQVPLRVTPVIRGAIFNDIVALPFIHDRLISGKIVSQPRILTINSQDSVIEVANLGLPGSTLPSIGTTMLGNGETLLLGGVLRNGEISNDVSKIPGLGEIPVLGLLFRRRVSDTARRNLVVFITPKVVIEGASPSASKPVGYQLFVDNDGKVYRKQIKNTGRVKTKAKEVFTHDNKLENIVGGEVLMTDAKGIPILGDKVEFVIIWEKKNSTKRHEIRLETLKLSR